MRGDKLVGRWRSERLERDVTLVRWGVIGRPVLIFPTAGGDAEEIERFLMIDALAPLIDSGRIKVYSCDSAAGKALLAREGSARHQMWLQNQFHHYIRDEVVPAIHTDCKTTGLEVWAAGSSIGAFHAVAAVCRFPDVFARAIAMSGTYDLRRFFEARDFSDEFWVSSPLHFVPTLAGRHLDVLRTRFVLLPSGEGRAEDIGESWRMAHVLGRQGIPNRVDSWGRDWNHDWPTWRKMLPQILDEWTRGVEVATTRVHKEVESHQDAQRQREFTHAILRDVRALERMIAENLFESGVRRIGAEQEMFLIDASGAPANGVLPMLERLHDEHYTTELGQFQLEANCDPQLLTGDGLARMHTQLDALVDKARAAANTLGIDVVLMGILPTMRKSDLGLDSMVPSQRYVTMNKIVTDLRGGKFEFSIKGLDELIIEHDSVMLEACNSSFQVHLQVSAEEFPRMYNIAQVLAGPMMAISANSPILFGRRLWAETRIALFRQAVDTRSHTNHLRETEARVSFGTRWVRRSVVEIYREDIARFRTLVGTDLDEDPIAKLDRGEIPLLKALRLHNGTIYRWNRACFGMTDGKAHLRIENRVMPAGPSTIDEIANAAFWCGLMAELGARGLDVTERIDFDQAGANFYTAAREGIGASFLWLDGVDISARELVLDRLLPVAEAGLHRQGIADADVKKYLNVVDERVRTGRTGARWAFSSWSSLRDRATPGERANALVAATVRRQQSGRPVSEWERATLDEAETRRHHYQRVDQYMTTDLFTVEADDAIEMVANLMIWERLRHVPVEDKHHHLVGVVSQRAVMRFINEGGSTLHTPVAAIMKSDVPTVGPDTLTLDAIRAMRRLRVSCLPVIDAGRLVGLITEEHFMDIALKLLEEQAEGTAPKK